MVVGTVAAELQRDPARMDAETVFMSSLLMKIGGWESYKFAYEELGRVVTSGIAIAASEVLHVALSGPPKGQKGVSQSEVDKMVDRERKLLPRLEALYLRGVCELQLAGWPDAQLAMQNTSLAKDGLQEHPPISLQQQQQQQPAASVQGKKEAKARQKEGQMYWAGAAVDLEAYVREAGPDAKVRKRALRSLT